MRMQCERDTVKERKRFCSKEIVRIRRSVSDFISFSCVVSFREYTSRNVFFASPEERPRLKFSKPVNFPLFCTLSAPCGMIVGRVCLVYILSL